MQQTAQNLPIDGVLDELRAQLARHPLVVLEAPPGTGKTTRVPAALLEDVEGQIWVLEPRRLAARWTSRWVAQQRGEELGETVGYQVRLDSRVGPKTRLIYLTQGVFVRRLLDNPQLRGVALVILDEFHERSLDNDFALAWMRRSTDRKTLIMSATLGADLTTRLGEVPIVRCESPLFPVAIGYDPSPVGLEQKLALGVKHSRGSGLIFLPGMREIRRCAQHLSSLAQKQGAELQILHGSLSSAEQDAVLQAPPNQLRWVLTTNVAETSLTVPGISWVIDSGLARVAVTPPGAALSRLETQRIAQFSATQRAGRAGRTGPGQCLRLYGEADLRNRPQAETPEIARADLSGLVLQLTLLDNAPLEWLDAPPQPAWEAALKLLHQLGALRRGKLTPLGKAMLRLPLEPRLAAFLLGWPEGNGPTAAAWLGRGGDRAQPELERYLARPEKLPEERQLRHRLPAEFARASLDEALLAAFPDRVAQVRRGSDLVFCDGSGYRLAKPLSDDPWLLALELEINDERQVQLSAYQRIEPELMLDRPELSESVELQWNGEAGRVESTTQLRYGALVLESSRQRAKPSAEVGAMLLRYAKDTAWWRESEARFAKWHARHEHARSVDDSLRPPPDLEKWLEKMCRHSSSLGELSTRRWEHDLNRELRERIDQLCPEWLPLGARKRAPVEYVEGQSPWLASKLVDFFGLKQPPQLAGGRIPLVLHLLAPNGRPVQITQDLAGFWERHYPKVRQELCRRYPRHPWPVDPLHPEPTELKPKKRS